MIEFLLVVLIVACVLLGVTLQEVKSALVLETQRNSEQLARLTEQLRLLQEREEPKPPPFEMTPLTRDEVARYLDARPLGTGIGLAHWGEDDKKEDC